MQIDAFFSVLGGYVQGAAFRAFDMTEATHLIGRHRATYLRLFQERRWFAAGAGGFQMHWLVGVALFLTVGITAWLMIEKRPEVHYTTIPISRGPITRAVTATGTVNPELTIIVGTYVSGVIQQLYCDHNTVVKKGQLCAKIDPRPYKTVVDQGKANLAVAKAELEKDQAALAYAKLRFDRAAWLAPTNAGSQDVVDNARSAYEQAQAQIVFDEATITQRQAELDAAQVNLDYTDITSPVDGVVVSRSVTMGQTVAAAYQTPTLFLIATDLTKMEVDFNVSETDVAGIKEGDSAIFSVDAYSKKNLWCCEPSPSISVGRAECRYLRYRCQRGQSGSGANAWDDSRDTHCHRSTARCAPSAQRCAALCARQLSC